jgi:hypothetical protein
MTTSTTEINNNNNNINDDGPAPPPATSASQRTLRAVNDQVVDVSDSVDVVDLCNGTPFSALSPPAEPPVTLTVRWRKVSRRVRFPLQMPADVAVAMLVHRLGRDGKRRDPETLVLVRRRVDAAGAVVHEPLEPRDAPIGQFALSDAGGDQLLMAARKCVECGKARIAACVTNNRQRLFLCRQCATVAGVKQLKVQQMVLVGQIGELETKLKRAKANAQTKKLTDALRLAKARHRGIQDDILAMTPDLPKLTTVPVELKRVGSGRGAAESSKLSPAASPRGSPRTMISKDEAPLTPRRSAPASPVNTPPEQ